MDVDAQERSTKLDDEMDSVPTPSQAAEDGMDGTSTPFKRYNAMLAVLKNTLYM